MVGRDGMETRIIQQSLRVHLGNKGGGRGDLKPGEHIGAASDEKENDLQRFSGSHHEIKIFTDVLNHFCFCYKTLQAEILLRFMNPSAKTAPAQKQKRGASTP